MRLPAPTQEYAARHERERNRTLEQEDLRNRKTDADVEVGGQRLVLTSPNGTRYNVAVNDMGILVISAL